VLSRPRHVVRARVRAVAGRRVGRSRRTTPRVILRRMCGMTMCHVTLDRVRDGSRYTGGTTRLTPPLRSMGVRGMDELGQDRQRVVRPSLALSRPILSEERRVQFHQHLALSPS
jgi:hypothetical protein